MVQKGTPPQEVADLLGVAARSIFYCWLVIVVEGGRFANWLAQRLSFEAGEADMRWIYETVTEEIRQEGFPFALWTLKMIGQLIRRELGVKLSRWSLSRLHKQMGLR